MWASKALYYGIDILLTIFSVYLLSYYFDIFFVKRKGKVYWVIGVAAFAIWQLGIGYINVLPVYMNLGITVTVTLFAVIVSYEGTWWKKTVFVAAFIAIWMLMETLCNYILVFYCVQYAKSEQLGSFISKLFFLIVIIALKKVFTNDEIKDFPARYSIMLVLIPTGSIYIMNNIFMLGYKVHNEHAMLSSAIAAIILLGMNILIFYIYMKLADDLHLRWMTSVYEQQLELCERHQQEREISILQLRDVRHNMKNNLVTILAYAENKECDRIMDFVNEIMNEGGITLSGIVNSGNIVIDSLVGYWHMRARKSGIVFEVKINIPMIMPFKGADVCLILGNLLENAVEAAQKAEGKRYIKIHMKYDKNNLLLHIANNYKGNLLRAKDSKLKSTKLDAGNHGVGLPSVYRVATKYHGTVLVDDSVPERFIVKVVLYGEQEKLHEQSELLHHK
ncbi:MAG: GHKL domain-containing protein [Lachnospiraceae bacterium]|nr:GHKL domain-containing protein [Lachnospiraceae bacterium]